jgi:cleavage and polyadenylation specificity factor subunit 4
LFLCSAAGLCKKGADTCESLHIYDLSKMPLCQFIIDYGACHNVDCLFNHTRPEAVEEKPDCIWYARGFCKHGPECKRRHRKKEMCPDYLGQWKGSEGDGHSFMQHERTLQPSIARG